MIYIAAIDPGATGAPFRLRRIVPRRGGRWGHGRLRDSNGSNRTPSPRESRYI